MTPEEIRHRSAEIAAEERARRMPDSLRRVFAVLIGGVGGELAVAGAVIFVVAMLGYSFDLTDVLRRALKVGPVLGFLPGLAAGFVYTRTSRERPRAYLSFLFGAVAGLILMCPMAMFVSTSLYLLSSFFRL
jgi:hypothetical protein